MTTADPRQNADFENAAIQSGWIDAKVWTERWKQLSAIEGGGQGKAYKAERIDDGKIAFVKVMKASTDRERRSRFFREASAYDSFRIKGTPKLIESNAHQHKNLSYVLYIATDFIEGKTFRDWRAISLDISFQQAVAATNSLLTIVKACHEEHCFHRDIKPENIIIQSTKVEDVFLLDFGMSYHEESESEFATENWQEIGNRFVRLPELSCGSLQKKDARSDLTFVAGILFFLMTGTHPDLLQDGEGKLPHQRGEYPMRLRKMAELKGAQLISFFDRAFLPRLSDRYADATEMQNALHRLSEPLVTSLAADDDFTAIMAAVNSEAQQRLRATKKRYALAVGVIQQASNELIASFQGMFSGAQTAQDINGSFGTNTLIWNSPNSNDRLFTMVYTVRDIGDEFVVQIGDESIYRTSIEEPDLGDALSSAVKQWVLPRVRASLEV